MQKTSLTKKSKIMIITKEFSNRLAIGIIILFAYFIAILILSFTFNFIGINVKPILKEFRFENCFIQCLVMLNFIIAFVREIYIKANK